MAAQEDVSDGNPQAEMMRQDALCSPNTKRKNDDEDRARVPGNSDDNPQAESMRQVARCPTDSKRDHEDRG
jgi:hypothetical protein